MMLITAGCSSARLECLLWEQEVVSSNLAIPTKNKDLRVVNLCFFCIFSVDTRKVISKYHE